MESHVYWTNFGGGAFGPGSTIGRANLDGTGVDQSFITTASSSFGVAVDGAHIYWTNRGPSGAGTMIGRANLDGTGVDQSFITGASDPTGVAVDGSHIYWTNFGGSFGTTIGRADLPGSPGCSGPSPCMVTQSFITGASAPVDVAVDDSHIYWSNAGSGGLGTTIGRANLDGTEVNQSFVTGASTPEGVAVDAGSSAAPINASAQPVSATEGQQATVQVATFTEADKQAASDYSATIDWGDGSSSTATVSGSNGSYSVSGSHAYADETTTGYTAKVAITDNDGTSANVSSTATVSDAPLSAQAVTFQAVSRQPLNGTVATFTDSNPGDHTGDFTAMIAWGDGSTSPGTVNYSNGSYTITGSHTYAKADPRGQFYPVIVSISDDGGQTATTNSSADVDHKNGKG